MTIVVSFTQSAQRPAVHTPKGEPQTRHLINLVPLGIEALLHHLAVEDLVADLQDAVRVGLALDQPAQKRVLPFQILGLQEVDPQDSLWRRRHSTALRGGDGDAEVAALDTSARESVDGT